MSQKIIKLIDRIAGSALVSILGKSTPARKGQFRSILIIRPGGIGDAVLLASSIICLKAAIPALSVTVLAEQRNADVFSLIPSVDKVLCYDRCSELMQALLGKYDVVIDTEQWYCLSAVVARLVRAPVRIGFATNERRRMFTNCVPYDQRAYEADIFPALFTQLGVESHFDIGTIALTVPTDTNTKVDELLQPLCSDSFMVIFPGASIEEKRWGVERFRLVAEALSAFGIKIVVVGGKEDRKQGEVISSGGLALNLTGMTSLPETAAVIQKSALLLSGDSGVLHIAAGLGVPTVSLFGPGRVNKWAPPGEHHVVIHKELPCSPCTTFGNTPSCPNNVRCMRNITVDEVVIAVTTLLTSMGNMPSRCCKRDWIETA